MQNFRNKSEFQLDAKLWARNMLGVERELNLRLFSPLQPGQSGHRWAKFLAD